MTGKRSLSHKDRVLFGEIIRLHHFVVHFPVTVFIIYPGAGLRLIPFMYKNFDVEERIYLWIIFHNWILSMVLNLKLTVLGSESEAHVDLVAIRLTPTLHFDWQSVSSLTKPAFILSSSTCFFHVLFCLPFLP